MRRAIHPGTRPRSKSICVDSYQETSLKNLRSLPIDSVKKPTTRTRRHCYLSHYTVSNCWVNISHVYATRKKATNIPHTLYYHLSLHEANVLCGHRVVSGHQPALGKLAEGSDTRPSAQYLCPNLQPIYYYLLRSIHLHSLCQRYLAMLASMRFWRFGNGVRRFTAIF